MEAEKERDEILKELRKIWFKKGCYFSNEILEFMKQIENKKILKNVNFVKNEKFI